MTSGARSGENKLKCRDPCFQLNMQIASTYRNECFNHRIKTLFNLWLYDKKLEKRLILID